MTSDLRTGGAQAASRGYQASSPELERWLARHIEQGFDAEALVLSMQRAGYDATFARTMVADALGQPKPKRDAKEPPARPGRAAALLTQGKPDGNALRHGDREIPILFAIEAPRVMLLQGLLTDAECDALVALSRDRMQRSSVVNPATGDENVIDARTSTGAMFQVGENGLLEQLEARIAAVTGVPADHGEGFQILNYKPGAEYQPHFDFFNPKNPGEARQMAVGGQRIATLVIYLNSTPAGGATGFPRIGLNVAPVKGNAVFFSYQLPDGTLDDRTLHGGMPVVTGEKWIATKWLRERPYRVGG